MKRLRLCAGYWGREGGRYGQKTSADLRFDGLIIDTESAEVKAWRKEFEEVGLVFDLDAFLKPLAPGPEIQHPVNAGRKIGKPVLEQIWANIMRSVEEGLNCSARWCYGAFGPG